MKKYFFLSILLSLCCFVSVRAQTAPPQTEDDKVYQRSEVDKPAAMYGKPRAETGGRCQRRTSGRVTIEVVLRKSGQVEILNVVQSSACDFFNKNAYEAAKGIKFDPAIKDGQPVSMSQMLQYNYSVY